MSNDDDKYRFHVVKPSFDVDRDTIEGQREIRSKFIDFSLAETVDIEEYIDRFDAAIPKSEHKILEMTGKVVRIGNKAAYYLEVDFNDPGLKQVVRQEAYITSHSIDHHVAQMLTDPIVRSDLRACDIREGELLGYTEYIVDGQVNSEPRYYVPGRFTVDAQEFEEMCNPDRPLVGPDMGKLIEFPKRKPNLTVVTERPKKPSSFNSDMIPNMVLAVGLISLITFGLYAITGML